MQLAPQFNCLSFRLGPPIQDVPATADVDVGRREIVQMFENTILFDKIINDGLLVSIHSTGKCHCDEMK